MLFYARFLIWCKTSIRCIAWRRREGGKVLFIFLCCLETRQGSNFTFLFLYFITVYRPGLLNGPDTAYFNILCRCENGQNGSSDSRVQNTLGLQLTHNIFWIVKTVRLHGLGMRLGCKTINAYQILVGKAVESGHIGEREEIWTITLRWVMEKQSVRAGHGWN